MSLMTYFIIGTLFTLGIDILGKYLKAENSLNNIERVVVIVLWPISMIVFFREFFRAKK